MEKDFISNICDKYYYIEYEKERGNTEHTCGKMLNYNSGNIVLLNDDGIWHIPYEYVKFCKPIIKKNKENNNGYKI
jgi:hypothetical protein